MDLDKLNQSLSRQDVQFDATGIVVSGQHYAYSNIQSVHYMKPGKRGAIRSGLFAATVVGVTVGVLRLSSNWLIARLMTIYVEVFRNIPLLLWILVVLAIFTDAGLDFVAAFKMDLYNENLTMTMIDGQNPFAEGETQLQMTRSYG